MVMLRIVNVDDNYLIEWNLCITVLYDINYNAQILMHALKDMMQVSILLFKGSFLRNNNYLNLGLKLIDIILMAAEMYTLIL